MTWEALRNVGSALGSGAVIIVGAQRNLLEIAGNLTTFFRNESCGKCVPCRIGTEKAVKLIEIGTAASLATLPQLREVMAETSICGLGQAALNPIVSVLENFPRNPSARTEKP
jgi:formate dehydrogenase